MQLGLPMRQAFNVLVGLGIFASASVAWAQPANSPIAPAVQARIDRILKATPLIDGHNDLPEQLRDCCNNKVEGLERDSDKRPKPLMTDIARLHAGRVGGQFWSVYIPSEVTGDAAIRETLEQIDVVHRLCAAYPRDLAMAVTAADVVRVHKSRRVACLIGIEGGHQIAGNLAALRQFRALGAGYMTLTHFKNNEWAELGDRRPGASRPYRFWPNGHRRDELHRHARRSQPCQSRNDARRASGDKGAGDFLAFGRARRERSPAKCPR